MLENDDPLNGFALFLETQGLQNETKMVPEEHLMMMMMMMDDDDG